MDSSLDISVRTSIQLSTYRIKSLAFLVIAKHMPSITYSKVEQEKERTHEKRQDAGKGEQDLILRSCHL
jgi:hypothetical protein